MKTPMLVGSAACLAGMTLIAATASAETRTETFAFHQGSSPALFISASGEGCCDFNAEIIGTFTVKWDSLTGVASIDKVDAFFTSPMVLQGGVAITNPSLPIVTDVHNWLEGAAFTSIVPGILSGATGQHTGDSVFGFGPGTAMDGHGFQYAWNYTISTDGQTSLLHGQSLFLGADGDYFYLNAPIAQVTPEPSALFLCLIGTVIVGLAMRKLRDA